jgi:aspartyl/asparaginyl beta-hydroxylase (cupin superfamily)
VILPQLTHRAKSQLRDPAPSSEAVQDHNVWNRTEADRIVLIVDVWHPDLTAEERTLLTGLHVYADVQSQAISTWRERDSGAQEKSRSKIPE